MCCIFCIVMTVAGLVGSTGTKAASAPEGCVALPSQSCSYTATRPGQISTTGFPWRVQIQRGNHVIRYEDNWAATTAQDVIKPGDKVTAWAGVKVTGLICIVPLAVASVVHVGSEMPQ